ncbi:hypothetical protein BH10PAT3_BH10PAT3_5460 [soil metagenome]
MIRKALLYISIALASVMPLALPAATYAAEGIQQNLCAGANLDVNSNCNSGGITDAQAQAKINDIIRTVINLFSLIVGVVSVIMIIIGGLKYITSGGDGGNVSSAKNTIIYAIVGIVIVALAQFIVRFVLTKITQ